jgi:hypothetical protein
MYKRINSAIFYVVKPKPFSFPHDITATVKHAHLAMRRRRRS